MTNRLLRCRKAPRPSDLVARYTDLDKRDFTYCNALLRSSGKLPFVPSRQPHLRSALFIPRCPLKATSSSTFGFTSEYHSTRPLWPPSRCSCFLHMDNLRFVLESPQLNQTHKKRPRLVTSCDNCRLKKIKCVQTKSHKCEACESTNVPCEFRDRERYFAERSRIVTGASAGSSGHSPRRSSTPAAGRSEGLVYTASPEPHSRSSSESHAWYSSGVPASGVDLAQQSRYASTSPAPYASSQPAPDAWFPHDSTGVQQRSTHGYVASPLGEPAQYSHQALPSGLPQDPYHLRFPNHRDTQLSSLFDPRQPEFPNPTLMGYLMPLFFERFERNFAFLRPEEVSRRHYNGSLSPALASSIAALGARYSQHQDVLSRGTSVVCDAYSSNAKRLLSASSHYPYLEILHAVILIAWGEYKNGRTAGCYEYSQMAMKMALSMGLSSDNVARSAGDGDQAIYRATWASVAQLQQLTST